MRLQNTAHTTRPWRIHELTRDFRLEDVWVLPGSGGPDEFPAALRRFASPASSRRSSGVVRALFSIRGTIGRVLGWDRADAGATVPTLRDRLPEDLCGLPSGPEITGLPFTTLYLTDDEWAAEIVNRTAHAVMHIGWGVAGPDGAHRAQMAVYAKPNGLLGTAYMAAINPIRRLVVYPKMTAAA